tara:strand:- start:9 stop:254 length:246 start_codon:yes stop_codon:yes gene_type:complete
LILIETETEKMKRLFIAQNKIEKINTIDGHQIDADAIINLMDDEIRERLHSTFAGKVTEQEFYDRYCEAHKEKFNEEFIVN